MTLMSPSHKMDPVFFIGSQSSVTVNYHLYINYNTVKFAIFCRLPECACLRRMGSERYDRSINISHLKKSAACLCFRCGFFQKKIQKQACIFIESVVYYHLSPLRAEFIPAHGDTEPCQLNTVRKEISERDQESNGEFDPGSGRTLAACLTHASRTKRGKELALFGIEWQTGE